MLAVLLRRPTATLDTIAPACQDCRRLDSGLQRGRLTTRSHGARLWANQKARPASLAACADLSGAIARRGFKTNRVAAPIKSLGSYCAGGSNSSSLLKAT